ncbi:hypothetical protein L226DRAFT_457325 [Lentinus tigrinus ALCF2SS1-7]|uniref:X-box-binding protein 1 n=1 Tax=Lentinus tigrinus ALCF2SS1-6 TaxID=1328759 RepID=A0A5C2S848_9APHY|nr:hypothetical protein L227DRAFT_506519 [Lentinus tigrinus ALCF2SS1-6]RPD78717.1 hypothetical protein L226DRAFT_457325 [Lentinus tigrinus ALCF2SS1-7]
MDLSFPSPPSTEAQSPDSHTDDLPSGPPRKRARSEVTPEERREARAHRNRIAAQNSRDRRKAQFAYLEHRVQELEEENRQLRAGMGLTELSPRPTEQKDEEREKDRAREKENEELRQRIKTLETGWEAVMKALAASGLPLNVPSAPSSSSSTSPSSNPSAPATSGHLPTTTFPVFVPQSPVFPISPAPSHTSSGSSTLYDSDDFDSTRHLARVATTDAPPGGSDSSSNRLQLDLNIPTPASYPQTIHIGDAPSAVDEVAMDDLFREILAPSPVSPTVPLPAGPAPARSRSQSISEIQLAPPPAAPMSTTPALPEIDWESEVEMQRLLAMLPVVQPDAAPMDAGAGLPQDDFPSALDLELNGWDLAGAATAPLGSMSSVSVF